jgi:drug/metabolite transporter (DMT)-like permease
MGGKSVLNPVVLAFIAGAVVSWGVYVPIVHRAAEQLHSSLRAFLFVGVAYFLTAVLIPLALIFIFNYDPTTRGQTPNFNIGPVSWGVAAGFAGAVGALCVIFAATNAGKGGALYVAPLVFAGAPIINTIVTMTIFHPVKKMPEIPFFLGLLLAACGAALVMIYKPAPDAPHMTPPAALSTDPSEASANPTPTE